MKRLVTRGWDRDILKEYEAGKLPILTVNMTRQCNYNCIYCHTDAGKKDKKELRLSEWKRIIDESIDLGNAVLWIGGRGEPLLDPAFQGVVRYASKRGLITILNTNGSLVTKDIAQLLHDNDVSPEVKIASFDRKAYDHLAGIRGKLPFLHRGLDNLLNAGYGKIIDETEEARITRISGMVLLAQPAYQSIPEVFRYCAEHNFTPVISHVVAAGRVVINRNLDELKISPEQNRQLVELGSKIMGYPLERGFAGCHIQYGLFVQNNGDLIVDRLGMSCDVCDHQGRQVIGNLRDISLQEGWRRIKALREKNKEAIARAYDEFRCYPPDCFAACPMALQSQKDYYEVTEPSRPCPNQKPPQA